MPPRTREKNARLANPHKTKTYGRWKKDASQFHTFSNRRTVNLTRADKSAISRIHNQLDPHIKAVQEGRAVFQKATPAQLRNIKNTKQYVVTNRGFFVYGHNIKKVRVSGRGRKTQITVTKPQRREVYFPVQAPHTNIVDLVNWMFRDVHPDRIRIAVNQYTASAAHSATMWALYAEDLASMENEILDDGYDTPFHGAFAIWDY